MTPYDDADAIALRLALLGESVIDVAHCWLHQPATIAAFLRLNGFDVDNPLDATRIQQLHHEAVVYLTDIHRYRLPLQIERSSGWLDLFLTASSKSNPRLQRFACMTLKVMHILHHLHGRELLLYTAIPESVLFERLNHHVFAIFDKMRIAGIGVIEFATSKKSRNSLTTKLLAKRDNLATHVFDRLRFRLVVKNYVDILQSLVYLFRHLVPCNYVVPEQSQNNMLTREFLQNHLKSEIWHDNQVMAQQANPNIFSAASYRCINFIADLPLRIDDFVTVKTISTPPIVFVQIEVQLLDLKTAKANEQGLASHALYKKRQHHQVRRRLEGMREN